VTGHYAYVAAEAGALGTAVAWTAAGGAAIGLVNTGTLRGALQGAFQSLATFGIGRGIDNIYANIAAHMMLGGLLEEMNGGDFGHGMLSAGLSKVIGLGIADLKVGDPMKIVLQGIAGGVLAEASGGDFANGAASFAIQFAFNQLMGGGKYHDGKPIKNDECEGCTLVPLRENGKTVAWAYVAMADAANFHLAQDTGSSSLSAYLESEIDDGVAGMAAGTYSFARGVGRFYFWNAQYYSAIGWGHVSGDWSAADRRNDEIYKVGLALQIVKNNPDLATDIVHELVMRADGVNTKQLMAFSTRAGLGTVLSPLGMSAALGDALHVAERAGNSRKILKGGLSGE
jgi:hypothetical protein